MTKKKRRSNFKAKVSKNVQQQQTQGSRYGHLNLPRGVNIYKETPGGRVRLDILPYEVTDPKHPDRNDEQDVAVPGELWYKRPYNLHRNVGVDGDTAVCPTSVGKRCPICDYRAKRMKEGASYQDEEIKALKASLRNLYVIVPLDSKDHAAEPHIWDISQFLFQAKLNDEIEEDESYGVFPDLEEGLTLKIRFSEEKLGNNTFAETSRIDFESRDEPYGEEILDKVPNLDEVLVIHSHDQLEAKFFELEDEPKPEDRPADDGLADGVTSEDSEEESVKPSRRKKSAAPEEADGEASDSEEGKEKEEKEEEEKEEEPPARAKRSQRRQHTGC